MLRASCKDCINCIVGYDWSLNLFDKIIKFHKRQSSKFYTYNKQTDKLYCSFKTLRLKKEISGQLQVESQTSFLIFQIHFCDGTKFNKEAGDV